MRKPTKEYPIATFLDNDIIQFYPQDIKSVWFTYLRYPKIPFWAYTIAPDGYPTYNPAGSTDIELPEMCMDELAATLLNRIGISVREQGLSNWAMATKNSGV